MELKERNVKDLPLLVTSNNSFIFFIALFVMKQEERQMSPAVKRSIDT